MTNRLSPAVTKLLAGIVVTPGPLATPCWVFPGAGPKGYAAIVSGGRRKMAHIWSYEHYVGEVPSGLQIDHLCRVRKCANPGHLEAVTQAENIRRGNCPGAIAGRTDRCKHGHSLSDAFVRANGSRACRTCNLLTQRRRSADPNPERRKIAAVNTRLHRGRVAFIMAGPTGLTRGELAAVINVTAANAGNCIDYLTKEGALVPTTLRRSSSKRGVTASVYRLRQFGALS